MNTQARAEKRPLGALGRMSFVVGMHVALLFVLARSFNLVPTTVFDKGVGVVIDETTPPEVPPPPPDPQFERHEVVLVPRETPIDTESDPERTITEPQRPERSVEGTGGSAEVVPVVVNVRQDPRRPLTQPPYPPFDQRMGNEGSVDIEIYVLPNGRVGDARVIRSSGFDRMDQSALDEARRRWRLQPATRDGEPFAQWHRLRVTFQLRNQ
jgi:protein TonB